MCLVSCITSFGADIPRVYLCRKCDISAIKEKRPNTLYCSAKGSHNWIDLGIVGENIYHCRKCRKIVYTAKRPNVITVLLVVATLGICLAKLVKININAASAV